MTWLWEGTHKESIPGFEASGRIIEMSGVTLYFFEHDRISGHWQVADRLSVYQQLMESQIQADA